MNIDADWGRENVFMDERRQFPRFSSGINLTLYAPDTQDIPGRIINFNVRTLDVSRGGLRLKSPQALTTGSRVGFELLNDTASRWISGIGKVKWCAPSKEPDSYEFGIAFPIIIEPRA
jgi:hypothetical protein